MCLPRVSGSRRAEPSGWRRQCSPPHDILTFPLRSFATCTEFAKRKSHCFDRHLPFTTCLRDTYLYYLFPSNNVITGLRISPDKVAQIWPEKESVTTPDPVFRQPSLDRPTHHGRRIRYIPCLLQSDPAVLRARVLDTPMEPPHPTSSQQDPSHANYLMAHRPVDWHRGEQAYVMVQPSSVSVILGKKGFVEVGCDTSVKLGDGFPGRLSTLDDLAVGKDTSEAAGMPFRAGEPTSSGRRWQMTM